MDSDRNTGTTQGPGWVCVPPRAPPRKGRIIQGGTTDIYVAFLARALDIQNKTAQQGRGNAETPPVVVGTGAVIRTRRA